MTITLRDYQHRAIDMLRPVARQRPILVLPVGAGKTTVAAEIIRRAVLAGKRVLFIAHRRELIQQAAERFRRFGIPPGIIMAGARPSDAMVQVASIQTLARREAPPADVVIVDEAHHCRAGSYLSVLKQYPDALIIGLTATPFRLDGRGLGFIFGAIVAPVTVRQLIDHTDRPILEPIVYAPATIPNLAGVHVRGGDFNTEELAERVNTKQLTGSIVEHWTTLARGKRTIVFAVNVEHSEAIVERFREHQVAAEHVDGGTPGKQRDAIFARLASGKTLVVSNVGIATEGWDLPALEVVVLARPTKSLCLHIQMIGRGMRAAEGKSCLVLDHAGNHHRLGMVTDEIEYSLDDKPKKTAATAPPVKQCKECYAIFSGGRACPQCGAEPESSPTAPPEETNEKLVRFTQQDKRDAYAGIVQQATRYRKKIGWARIKFRERFETWPRFRDVEAEHYRCPGHVREITDHGGRCVYCLKDVPAEMAKLPRPGSSVRAVFDAIAEGAPIPPDSQRFIRLLREGGFIETDSDGSYRVTAQWLAKGEAA